MPKLRTLEQYHDGADALTRVPRRDDILVAARDTLPEGARVVWNELSKMDQTDLHGVLIRALDTYWAKRLAEETRVAYEALRAEPAALAAYEQECSDWEATLRDGLEDE